MWNRRHPAIAMMSPVDFEDRITRRHKPPDPFSTKRGKPKPLAVLFTHAFRGRDCVTSRPS